ncbi:glycosyltransferase family 2 protein [Vreelandella andesensis]|uniref:Glycosyltransferase family 2 protein n=1 Tax=Vreelandella andesensis TaxID=447567 RepID=A0A3S0XRP0_9GAMM|nr:glycosyltransferase family 2 protein [Halomonas andesensis]RUR28301.1 glycosyltransferase family 2 protein [Halomonas andesensis]
MSFYDKEIESWQVSDDLNVNCQTRIPRVSVIVPTYYDWERLKKCVVALEKQTLSQDDYEVIIVNNASDDCPPPDFLLPKNFIMITEAKPGSYSARNAALKISRGEIVAFTDSDCIPDSHWLETATSRLDKGAERIAGHVDLFFKSDKLTLVEIYEKAFGFDQQRYAQRGGAVTANMVTWRKNFEIVGFFNDSLMSGGDNEWGVRAYEKGIPVEYAQEVIVNHPARSDVKTILKKRRRVLGGEADKMNKNKKKNFFLILIKGYFPPRKAMKFFLKKELTLSQKVSVYFLCYYFKSYSATYRLALLLGLAKPERS